MSKKKFLFAAIALVGLSFSFAGCSFFFNKGEPVVKTKTEYSYDEESDSWEKTKISEYDKKGNLIKEWSHLCYNWFGSDIDEEENSVYSYEYKDSLLTKMTRNTTSVKKSVNKDSGEPSETTTNETYVVNYEYTIHDGKDCEIADNETRKLYTLFDENGLPVEAGTVDENGTYTGNTTYEHDEKGNLVYVKMMNYEYFFTYDENNKLQTEKITGTSTLNKYEYKQNETYVYSYDIEGKELKSTKKLVYTYY